MNTTPDPAGLALPPLSLYVHLPWCVRKCPYCDFNSHELKQDLPAERYVEALLRDLEQELPLVWGRSVQTVFIGGGTPSLFPAEQIERMLSGFRALIAIAPGAEITLEANPGTIEHDSFSAYGDAGVNRVSLGVQTFDDGCLQAIGRIHDRRQALGAIESLRESTIRNFNIDLMFGLPGQTTEGALDDVRQALEAGSSHLSHYQLTLEPNTAFHARPPVLPDPDRAWEMQEECARELSQAGFCNYEVSAWALPGSECRHNLNYWAFGDYIGIGAGAHGKITLPADSAVRRRMRKRHPNDWLAASAEGKTIALDSAVAANDLAFEFFLNHLRLRDGVPKQRFEQRTGLPWDAIKSRVEQAVAGGLLEENAERVAPTSLGWRFLNDLQALFLP
jgi:oxygen-independent coproporphyrinogen-3 oxidase